MISLQDLLGQSSGSQAVDQISQNIGADQSTVSTAVQAALPMLINGLANNASQPQGAESLNNALDQNHSGGILDNIGGLAGAIFGGGQAPVTPENDGGSILGNVFGGRQEQAAEQVSKQSGLSSGQAMQILMFLAPIVMGYLGRQKREQGIGAGGLGGLLGGLLAGSQGTSAGNPMINMASGYLDRNRDGSAVDDIAAMASDYLNKK